MYPQNPQPQDTPPQQQPPQPQPLGSPAQSEQQAPQTYGIDYLNQIAPPTQKRINKFAVFGLIGGVLAAVVFAVILIANSGGPDLSTQAKAISGRIATLQSVTDAQQPRLKETALNEANATLSTALSSMETEFAALLKERKITTKSVVSTEKTYAATLTKKLDDSYQRGTLDRTYPSQMTYELTLLRSKIKKFDQTANSKSIGEFSDTAITNIDAILAAYARSSATQ
ncbi:hypothetical protein EOL96_04755 [Candidatus Saccharibacteria bacterium]|nr:hypothetical protein [Candidatus Saccharibacteria bacterium]